MDKSEIRKRFGKIGFVCGPGGARGAWGAGALIPFKEYGIVPDFISATSVGTLNAAALVESSDPSRAAAVWRQKINAPRDIFEHNPIKKGKLLSETAQQMSDLLLEKKPAQYYWKAFKLGLKILMNHRKIWNTPNLISPRPLIENVLRKIDIRNVHNSPIEFEIICTDKTNWRKKTFSNRDIKSSEDLFKAIVASFSISGVFPPVEIQGREFVDGSPSNALPIINALDKDCKTIFVFCLHPADDNFFQVEGSRQNIIKLPESAKNYLGMMGALFANYEDDMIELTRRIFSHVEIHVLRPKTLPMTVETLFFNKEDINWMLEDGEKTASKLLKKLIPA